MKRIKRKRIAVIEAETAALFENAINKRLDEVSEYKYTLEIEHHQPHTAYIHYEYDEYVPETLADEFNLKGINYKCKDCKYCHQISNADGSADKRRKSAYCNHHERQVHKDFDACDTYYFELVSRTGQFDKAGADIESGSVKALEENTTSRKNKHEAVGNNLKALRECKGVSMSEAARQLGVPYQTYRSWEIGRNRLAGSSLKNVADYYGCDVSDILAK